MVIRSQLKKQEDDPDEVVADYRYLREPTSKSGGSNVSDFVDIAGVNDTFEIKALTDYQAMKLGFLEGEADGYVLDGAPAETVVAFFLSGAFAL